MIPATAAILVLIALATVLIALASRSVSFDSQDGITNAEYSGRIQHLADGIAYAEGFGVPGAIPTIAHNPGDLVLPGWSGPKLGAEGISVFPNDNYGWSRLYHQLQLIADGRSRVYTVNDTIRSMAHKWTNTQAGPWASNVASYLGVSTDTTIGEILGV